MIAVEADQRTVNLPKQLDLHLSQKEFEHEWPRNKLPQKAVGIDVAESSGNIFKQVELP